jgi:hypothetical protein
MHVNVENKQYINREYIKAFFKDFLLFNISNTSFTFLNTYNCPVIFYKQYILKHKDIFNKRMFFGKVVHYLYEILIKETDFTNYPYDIDSIDDNDDSFDRFVEFLKPYIEQAVNELLDEYVSINVEEIYYSNEEIFREKEFLNREQILPR